MKKIRAILENEPGAKRSIADLSREAGMSPTKFKELFRFYFGNPVYAYQKMLRLNRAFDLLTDTSYTLKKIAGLCGYRHAAHFNEAFSKRFLITPHRLRKDWKSYKLI